MMPMPPSCAIAMARRASVTVSIAADSSGNIQADVAGQTSLEGRVGRQDIRVSRDEQHVIERECFLK
jgi:hypothetical protein